MATVTVLYPRGDNSRFDYAYYENSHIPLLHERWGGGGLQSITALRGTAAAAGGDPAFVAMCIIRFDTDAQMQAALFGEHAEEVTGDVANFTDIRPLLQLNDEMAS